MISRPSQFQTLPPDLFKAQKRFIRELLGEEVFNKLSRQKGDRHPAIEAIDICERMINQNQILKWPEDESVIDKILATVLDSYIIIKCSGGEVNEFTLGNFANYGEPQVRKRLVTRLEDRTDFLSLMTELSCAASFYKNPNYHLTALDDETSAPDFKLISACPPSTITFECKRMMAKQISENNIKGDVNKANKQLRKFSQKCGHEICGVLILDLSTFIKPQRVTLNEHLRKIPPDVYKAKEKIANLIKSNYSSVSGVLILWNEYQLFNSGSKSLFTFHKRGVFVPHQVPKQKMLPGIIKPDWGYTLGLPVQWKERTS